VPAVAHLFIAPKRRQAMEEVPECEALVEFGFGGCSHARRNSKRQVLLVDKETLEAVELAPGAIRENITTAGLNVNGLALGERLRVGPALLEVSAVCTPCDQLERLRAGLRRELWGRRGMLCRVLQGGVIRRGDPIERAGTAG